MYETVLSSKGQIVLPAAIRENKKLKVGTRFRVFDTPFGLELIEIPKDPVKALVGLAKHISIPEDAVKKMRQRDDELVRRKYHF